MNFFRESHRKYEKNEKYEKNRPAYGENPC